MPRHLASALIFVLLTAARAGAQPPAIDNQTCLGCHADPSLALKLADGTSVPLQVGENALAGSVHARHNCVDCHAAMAEVPHPERAYATKREVSVALDAQCRKCHFANYAKTLDSVHQQAVARGDRTAPLCVDCHGSHAVKKPSTPRTLISETCARCHEGVAAQYARSVHGRDLTGGNPDVPTCTDCHHAHDVAGPRKTEWELKSPEMCGRCHADAAMMKKYGLSTNVLRTYLADFHG